MTEYFCLLSVLWPVAFVVGILVGAALIRFKKRVLLEWLVIPGVGYVLAMVLLPYYFLASGIAFGCGLLLPAAIRIVRKKGLFDNFYQIK